MLHNCYQLFAHKQSCAREMHKIRLNGWCDARNFGKRNPRHGALQGMARTRMLHGGGSFDLCSPIRKCPDLRVNTIGRRGFYRGCQTGLSQVIDGGPTSATLAGPRESLGHL